MPEQDLIKRVVAEVLAEQKRLHNDEIDKVSLETISKIFTSFGIDEEDRAELRADFQHLRRWRKASETVEKTAWRTVITIFITGAIGLIWLGIQSKFGK